MDPIFKFGEKFELDAKKEYRRLLRKKKQLKKAEQEAFAKGQEVDPKLVLEVKQMEKEMRRTGNSFLSGKSRLTSRKSGKASDESSEEEGDNKSKTKSRVSLLDQ